MRIRCGTSGYSYREWKPDFYPEDCPSRRWLAYYAGRFDTVELNATFYRLPAEPAVATWRDQVSGDFQFAVKAPRTITHRQKLVEAEEELLTFLRRISLLGRRLGPVLFQLPPGFQRDEGRLSDFLDLLPPALEAAFEFRHPSWYHRRVLTLLETSGRALCHPHLNEWMGPRMLTAPWAYVRLHGTDGWFRGGYGPEFLGGLARWLDAQPIDRAYVFFNNTMTGHAVQDALTLSGITRNHAMVDAAAAQ